MWEDIYKENKRLDIIFMSKYKEDSKIYEKNCIELMNEISEFANETKCFKYWSIKKMNKEKALEEYADVITMSLSFFTILNVKLEIIPHTDTIDVLYLGDLFNFSDKEKYDACYKKMKIIEERLNSDY